MYLLYFIMPEGKKQTAVSSIRDLPLLTCKELDQGGEQDEDCGAPAPKGSSVTAHVRIGADTDQAAEYQEKVRHQAGQITFFDNSGALRFSVSSIDLYYIESDDNYINVWYSDKNGALKMYMLRCSLKDVETRFKGTTLLRCHRKYIVNLLKAKVLRKEKDGYFIDLDSDAIAPIPVSKTYSDNVTEYFSSVLG